MHHRPKSEYFNPSHYPSFIQNLPEADVPLDGLVGRLLQADSGQVVFFETAGEVSLPKHSHCDQWGFVIEGSIELTIGGETRLCRAGDSYYIPAGTVHSGRIHPGFKAMDFFTDGDRYRPKNQAE